MYICYYWHYVKKCEIMSGNNPVFHDLDCCYKKSDNLILTDYILDNDCQLNILLKLLKVDWICLKNLSQSDICLLPHFLGKMGVFDISFTNTYNSILLCTEYTYAYTTAADIVLYTWKPKYLHIIFSYYIHVKNEGRSLLGFSPLSHFFG